MQQGGLYQLGKKICNADYDNSLIPCPRTAHLVSRMLAVDPASRPSIQEVCAFVHCTCALIAETGDTRGFAACHAPGACARPSVRGAGGMNHTMMGGVGGYSGCKVTGGGGGDGVRCLCHEFYAEQHQIAQRQEQIQALEARQRIGIPERRFTMS